MNGNKETPTPRIAHDNLLPIREAYEWKHQTRFHPVCAVVERNILLPIREAYEWKLTSTNRVNVKGFVTTLASNSWSV